MYPAFTDVLLSSSSISISSRDLQKHGTRAYRPLDYLVFPSSVIRGIERVLSSGLLKVNFSSDGC